MAARVSAQQRRIKSTDAAAGNVRSYARTAVKRMLAVLRQTPLSERRKPPVRQVVRLFHRTAQRPRPENRKKSVMVARDQATLAQQHPAARQNCSKRYALREISPRVR